MKVVNVHQRLLYAPPEQVGELIDSLASPSDALWPGQAWPRLKLNRPLSVGAAGGHGPIPYFQRPTPRGRWCAFVSPHP
ncbi:MAG: SRPBCC family protein, partial [Rhodoferax sp.]|nr:SRPBCC family protein [Rhodoferax sp.]